MISDVSAAAAYLNIDVYGRRLFEPSLEDWSSVFQKLQYLVVLILMKDNILVKVNSFSTITPIHMHEYLVDCKVKQPLKHHLLSLPLAPAKLQSFCSSSAVQVPLHLVHSLHHLHFGRESLTEIMGKWKKSKSQKSQLNIFKHMDSWK